MKDELYHRGIHSKVFRSTLADKNENRDWRIYRDFVQILIPEASELYIDDDFGLQLTETVYALDATSIDLCRTKELYGHLIVERVTSGSPSEKAGIKTGDIILAVNKQDVHGMADFYRKVWALGKAGVAVPLSILQGVHIREIVIHSATQNQYLQPVQKEKQTGIEL